MSRKNFKSNMKKRRTVGELRKRFGKPERKCDMVDRLRNQNKRKNYIMELEDMDKNRNKNKFMFSYYSNLKSANKLCFEELRKILKSIDCEILRYEKKLQSFVIMPEIDSKLRNTALSEYDSDDILIEEKNNVYENSKTYDSSIENNNSEEIMVSSYNSDSFGNSDISKEDFKNKNSKMKEKHCDDLKYGIKQKQIYENYLQELFRKRKEVMDKILRINNK